MSAVQTAQVNVAPSQYLAGWKPEVGSLFVPALSDAKLGEHAAVRIGLVGQSLRATFFGVVALVRRTGRPSLPPGAEIALDPESRRTAALFAAAARGAAVTFRDRPPRFLLARQVLAVLDDIELPATTNNVSPSGCAISWSGSPPEPGDQLRLRLGDGLFAPVPHAVVAWATTSRAGARVGLRIVGSGRGRRAWERLATDAERSGAFRL